MMEWWFVLTWVLGVACSGLVAVAAFTCVRRSWQLMRAEGATDGEALPGRGAPDRISPAEPSPEADRGGE